jgi:hypothetical protein
MRQHCSPGGTLARHSRVFNPVTGTFLTTGVPTILRSTHPAVSLVDGRVLFAGGYGESTPGESGSIVDAEVFDPATGSYAVTGSLGVARSFHTTTALLDGRVLVVGGGDTCASQCTAEVYDAAGVTSVPVGTLSVGRSAHTTTVLDSGLALIVGGTAGGHTGTAEVFDPAANTFQSMGSLNVPRSGHTATLLADGSVLFVGGNGPLAAQSAELFAPTPVAPITLAVTPSTAALEMGASRAFTAVDHLGHPRADAVWSSTNPSVLAVDPNSGTATAVAAGNVTLTATIGGVSGIAQIVVTTGPLPAGTPLWTVASPPGATSHTLLPVGGGLMSVSATATQTELQALTADGQHAWAIALPGVARDVVPNASGGVLVTLSNGCNGARPLQIVSIDGPTGLWAWAAEAAAVCNYDLPQIAVRHDGAVAVSTPGNVAGFPNLMMLNGDTGTPLSVPTIPPSTFTSFGGQQTPGYSRVGPTMIDVDGTTHLLYEQRFLGYPPQVVNTGIWLMSVRADQTWTTTQLSTTTANVNLFPGRIIPDGQGGLLASWIESPIVPAGQPPAQSTFRAYRKLAGGGGTPFDLPITPPLDLLHPVDSPLPTNPELLLGEGGRAFASYGNSVGGFFVNDGTGGWSYAAASQITMVATANVQTGSDPSLVAKTPAVDGTDTILRFQGGGGAASTSTFGVANVSHLVKDLWITSSSNGFTGALKGENIDWATTGWFSAEQSGKKAPGKIELVGASRLDPEQSVIRSTYQQAKFKLEQDAVLPNPTCSTWFNSGLTGTTAAQYILDAGLLDDRFGHAVFKKGGSEAGGDSTSAFVGDKNWDRTLVPGIGPISDAAVTFNRRGSFFVQGNWFTKGGKKVGPFLGATPEARLVIALHELAHLLQDRNPDPNAPPIVTSVVRVPDFTLDGHDETGRLSEANTSLVLQKCRAMVERP